MGIGSPPPLPPAHHGWISGARMAAGPLLPQCSQQDLSPGPDAVEADGLEGR